MDVWWMRGGCVVLEAVGGAKGCEGGGEEVCGGVGKSQGITSLACR